MKDVLYCIIAGPEQSGTSMLGSLVAQSNLVGGRFEAGLLLDENVSDFIARKELIKNIKNTWNINQGSINFILNSNSHQEAYFKLKAQANIEKDFIYDKFPGYCHTLDEILNRMKKPCLANVRDPRAIVASRKRNQPHIELSVHCEQINSCFKGLTQAINNQHEIYLVQHEKLCLNKTEEAKKIYDFLGLDFSESFCELKDFPQKGQGVKQGGISTRSLFDYKQILTQKEQDYVLAETKEYKNFYHNP